MKPSLMARQATRISNGSFGKNHLIAERHGAIQDWRRATEYAATKSRMNMAFSLWLRSKLCPTCCPQGERRPDMKIIPPCAGPTARPCRYAGALPGQGGHTEALQIRRGLAGALRTRLGLIVATAVDGRHGNMLADIPMLGGSGDRFFLRGRTSP